MEDPYIIAIVTGLISSVGTIAAIKVDIGWIKLTLKEHANRIKQLEKRLADIEKGA
ncbi:hypothetical protein TUMSATVNIG1_16370 [Vibrio nigripulchritudo]|uniref:hypothetical protein n=1 Tax=Vibrio TaxID=662 RepID=UPI00190BA2D0|nr:MULTISPECIES: hypothetical protein [Vibrio]UAB68827.1 hypothetical protein INR79_09730 [Vibrio sp. SCSIO 43132]UAB74123.1 hypothetical protein INR79_24375 [Vibrio sp. SCSIO 43132]BCL69681.1 hypothetical protein VNTUMSATTG_16180 [Vibrio nigripulchritudo]BDU31028.1 hypothetical protein TUMSATVNIG1_16370 [Vibrio nigripulchritudo]BDU37152.1 hypothetical protein TUMSATVNIG2_16210 [Vibrio nigripulchritudo]